MRKNLILAGAAVVLITIAACTPQANVNELTAEEQKSFLEQVIDKTESATNRVMKGTVVGHIEDQEFTMNAEFKINGENSNTTLSAGDAKLSTIVIGNTSYIGDGKDKWYEMAESDSEDSSLIDTNVFTDFQKFLDSQNYEYKGVQDCNGRKCQVFEFKEGDDITTIFFDGTEYLIRKMAIESPESGGTFDVEYGGAGSISAPSGAEKVEGFESLGKVLELYTPLLEGAGVNLEDLQ